MARQDIWQKTPCGNPPAVRSSLARRPHSLVYLLVSMAFFQEEVVEDLLHGDVEDEDVRRDRSSGWERRCLFIASGLLTGSGCVVVGETKKKHFVPSRRTSFAMGPLCWRLSGSGTTKE